MSNAPASTPSQTPVAQRDDVGEDPLSTHDRARTGLRETVVRWCTAGLAIQVGCTLFSHVHPILELGAHFAMHALVAGILWIPILLIAKRFKALGISCLSVLILLLVLQPWNFLGASATPDNANEAAATSLKVLSWNVLTSNKAFAKIESIVEDQDPDIIVFLEVRPNFLENIPNVVRKYPHLDTRASWGGEGIAILTRNEQIEFEFLELKYPRQPALVATIPSSAPDSLPLKLVGLHALSPLPVHRARIRDTQLRELQEWSSHQTGPICICGDFNITPWSKAFLDLTRSGFVDSRIGSGNCASWPSPLGFMALPIDHAISKGACSIENRVVLTESPGSDHKPIAFTISY